MEKCSNIEDIYEKGKIIMAKILVSGLINIETTVKVREFPINYYPIDYPFFGVNSSVSGVGYNLCRAYTALGDEVRIASMTGSDTAAIIIRGELSACGVSDEYIKSILTETPASVVLYDESGKRQIYCDLKDIQDHDYNFSADILEDIDIVVACNINFNRPLLTLAKSMNKPIATDVHVLNSLEDEYNRDFMAAADILFLSDEGIKGDHREFMLSLHDRYHNKLIVLGMGKKGALLFDGNKGSFVELPAYSIGDVQNTVGAGDALFSSFIHYYAKGFSPADALDRAQLFAALKIQHSGGAKGFPSEGDVEKKIIELSN